MILIEEFNTIFEDRLCEESFPITINEADSGSFMNELKIEDKKGGSTCYKIPNRYYNPGIPETPNLFSSVNCDGIRLIFSPPNKYHLVLVELKSTLDDKDIVKASKQLLCSFVKFWSFLSFCSSSAAVLQSVKAIMCFKNYKDEKQKKYYENQIVNLRRKQEIQGGGLGSSDRWYVRLVVDERRKIQLREFWEFRNFSSSLHPSVANAEIDFRLLRTKNYEDTGIAIDLSELFLDVS